MYADVARLRILYFPRGLHKRNAVLRTGVFALRVVTIPQYCPAHRMTRVGWGGNGFWKHNWRHYHWAMCP